MIVCPKCGSDLPNGVSFCHICGAKLPQKKQPVQTQQYQQQAQEQRQQAEPSRQKQQPMQEPPVREQQTQYQQQEAPNNSYRREEPMEQRYSEQRSQNEYDPDRGYREERVSQPAPRREKYNRPEDDYEGEDDDVEVDEYGNEIRRGPSIRGGFSAIKNKAGSMKEKARGKGGLLHRLSDEDYEDEEDDEGYDAYREEPKPVYRREQRESRNTKANRPVKNMPQETEDVYGSWNELCIIAVIISMIGLCGNIFAAIAAVVLGVKGRAQAYERGQAGGDFGMTAIVLGTISCVLFALGLLLVAKLSSTLSMLMAMIK